MTPLLRNHQHQQHADWFRVHLMLVSNFRGCQRSLDKCYSQLYCTIYKCLNKSLFLLEFSSYLQLSCVLPSGEAIRCGGIHSQAIHLIWMVVKESEFIIGCRFMGIVSLYLMSLSLVRVLYQQGISHHYQRKEGDDYHSETATSAAGIIGGPSPLSWILGSSLISSYSSSVYCVHLLVISFCPNHTAPSLDCKRPVVFRHNGVQRRGVGGEEDRTM